MSRTLPVKVARRNRVVDADDVVRSSMLSLVVIGGLGGGLGGCDIAFMLERPVQQTVCGSFGDEEEVRFGEGMKEITDFSFNGPGTRGFVRAIVNTANGPRTGPAPVILDNGIWSYDPELEANWLALGSSENVILARMARDNDIYVAQQFLGPPTSLHVFHYGFRNGTWVPIEMEIAFTTNTDAIPGGELSIPVEGSDPPASFDFLPIFRYDQVDRGRTVAIAVRPPTSTVWQDQEMSGGALSTEAINTTHEPWSGALARTPDGQQVLIYAATDPNDPMKLNSDLYISEKRNGRFLEGVPLTNFNSSDEEVDPWISEDCSMITFRRTKRGAPFDGESRSGGKIYMSTLK